MLQTVWAEALPNLDRGTATPELYMLGWGAREHCLLLAMLQAGEGTLEFLNSGDAACSPGCREPARPATHPLSIPGPVISLS